MTDIHILFFPWLITPILFWAPISDANGLFEVTLGSTHPSGSTLDAEPSWGGQLTLGWGGKLPTMGSGSAIYGYGAIRHDALTQRGHLSLGSPSLERSQWTPSFGLRFYNATSDHWRLWLDLGLGCTFDRSEVSFRGIGPRQPFSGETGTLSIGAGLQYKISAGLLLSLSYEQLFYMSPDQLGFAEEALLTGSEPSISGRGRWGVGIGFYL